VRGFGADRETRALARTIVRYAAMWNDHPSYLALDCVLLGLFLGYAMRKAEEEKRG
jgi:hypothetical protein